MIFIKNELLENFGFFWCVLLSIKSMLTSHIFQNAVFAVECNRSSNTNIIIAC